MFVIDLEINFHLCFPDDNGELVFSFRRIASRYVDLRAAACCLLHEIHMCELLHQVHMLAVVSCRHRKLLPV